MSWFSILPEQLSVYEVWAVRFFLFLGALSIGPWVLLIIYDFVLYVWRTVTYEIPVVGGRARGRGRPRAPSLKERPSGTPRRFSINAVASTQHDSAAASSATDTSPRNGIHRHEAVFEDQ